jgi:alkylated DNA repair dioxygenase AlkB
MMEKILDDQGEVYFLPSFLDHPEDWFNQLYKNQNEIDWQQDEIKLFGKVHPLPRLQAWHGERGTVYSYSGLEMQPKAWTPILLKLKKLIDSKLDHKFNSCLLNLYRDGKDSNGPHSDNEKELGENPLIASLSLGEERLFRLMKKKEKKKIDLLLPSGSLLVMKGPLQKHWKHTIPKSLRALGPRINLTFRTII